MVPSPGAPQSVPFSAANHYNATLGTQVSGGAETDGSVRLLTEWRQSQGPTVMFPPISQQERGEKERTNSLIRDYSKK